jgi:hypothetical protein
VTDEYHWPDSKYDRSPSLVREYAVKLGLVASYTSCESHRRHHSVKRDGDKNLQLLHELSPKVAVECRSRHGRCNTSRTCTRLALGVGGQRTKWNRSGLRDLGALLVGADPFFAASSQQLAALAANHRIPAIYIAAAGSANPATRREPRTSAF